MKGANLNIFGESFLYILIVNNSNFQSKIISYKNSMVLETPFHFKMSPVPTCSLFLFKNKLTRNSPHDSILVLFGRLWFWNKAKLYLHTRFWANIKNYIWLIVLVYAVLKKQTHCAQFK